MRRLDVMTATAVVLMGSFATHSSGEDEQAGGARTAATEEGIREVLERVWEAPPDKVKRVGSSVLNKYRREGASLADLQFAYGVALCKHREWSAAETNFRNASRTLDRADIHLALSHLHLRLDRPEQAINDMKKAFELAPTDPATIQSLAKFVTFIIARGPLGRVRADDGRLLEGEVYPQLTDAGKLLYRQARDELTRFLEEAPKRRDLLLPPLDEARDEIRDIEQDRADRRGDFDTLKRDYDERRREIDRIEAAATNDAISLDQLISIALANKNIALARQYQQQRTNILREAELRTAEYRQQLVGLERELTQLDAEIRQLDATIDESKRQIDEALNRIDTLGQSLPDLWSPAEEKRRLTRTEPVEGAPEPRPVDPEEQLTAQCILGMADSLSDEQMTRMARRYYDLVARDFPNTLAADIARDRIKEIDQASEEPDTKRSKRKR